MQSFTQSTCVWMELSDINMCLCGWWEGDGAFRKSSWISRKASSSSCCTNKENSFYQFSSPLDEAEIEVWVEIWIRSLQYLSTQLMVASSYSMADPIEVSSYASSMEKRLSPENSSGFLWKRSSAWFWSGLFAQFSSTCKTKCISWSTISWDSSICSRIQSTLCTWLNGV